MIITGCLVEGRAVVCVNGRPLDPARSQRLWNHSPDGFAWGYGGSGPAQLALALLLAANVGRTRATRLHQRFKVAVIAPLPFGQPFQIEIDIREWVRRTDRPRDGKPT